MVSVVNGGRLAENKGSLVRVTALDKLARAHSRLMADSKQLDSEPPEIGCNLSGTHVVRSPQVKSFSYRGDKNSPSSTTPTKYNSTAQEMAAGVVKYMHEGEYSYTRNPQYKYVGIGVVQVPDNLGFMDFWVTFYLADCPVEESTGISTPKATTTPSVSPTPTIASSSLRDFVNGRWLEQQDPQLATSIKELGWVKDGIDETESAVIQDLLYIAVSSRPLASSIVSLGWVKDGVDSLEAAAIKELSYLTDRDADAALRITGMPFVETIDPHDISAIKSLRLLAAYNLDTFVEVLTHPTLGVGISDNLAPVVATLRGVAKTNPGLIDILLDGTIVSVERRTITLPFAGDVSLSIIRTGPGAATSMDLLEHSLRGVEEFMGEPLPTNYVGLLFADAVTGDAAGTNFGTHIAILPKYDVADGSFEAEIAGSTIAHEVAHYYWSGNEDWLDEGAANFTASVIDGARTGRQIAVTRPPCAYARSLGNLESLGISKGDIEFQCNYSLGERLFADLYRTLGHERFREGFRDLYLASEIEDEADDLPGTAVGVEHVGEALRSDDGLESVVISRWYDGTEPYDLSRLDKGPVDPNLPSINGRIDEAYVVTSKGGPAVSTFSAQDISGRVYLTMKYSYDVSGDPQEVPFEIVEYYQDGFEFRRRGTEFTAMTGYIGGTSRYSVGQSPPRNWATGRYWVYVYSGERKVAELQYEVTP